MTKLAFPSNFSQHCSADMEMTGCQYSAVAFHWQMFLMQISLELTYSYWSFYWFIIWTVRVYFPIDLRGDQTEVYRIQKWSCKVLYRLSLRFSQVIFASRQIHKQTNILQKPQKLLFWPFPTFYNSFLFKVINLLLKGNWHRIGKTLIAY